MKKLLVLVCALVVVAACAAPPPNQNTAPTNANIAAAPPVMTETEAIAKEKAIWETLKVKDYDAFGAMLATDQIEVMSEGVMDKTSSIEGVKQFEPSEVTFSDWKFTSIDADAFLLTYSVAVKGKYRGKDFPLENARASSAWVYRDGKWLAIYHQECAVKPATPPPAAKAATPTPAISPATAAPAPVTGPDPIANEKVAWDLFKARNYDAFAELLVPEFVEVAPDGVYDKAGTVKGVQTFDANKAVLSDFKAVNIDDDAALVTYVVKAPGPVFTAEGERHSTIWVKRAAKWMILFHHGGTPVRTPAATPTPRTSPSPATAASPTATRTPASPTATRTP